MPDAAVIASTLDFAPRARPPGAVARANRALESAWSSGLLSRPGLAAAALAERAAVQTGLDDFGTDDHWYRSLETLTHGLENEAALNPLGRTIAHGQLVGVLRSRLRAHALWTAHPEILDLPITAPVIVLGQMRSGTTRLQRLLACDPRLDHTRFYESCLPVPQGARRPLVDLRRPRAALGLATMRAVNPGFAAIHPTSAGAPDEEVGLLGIALTAAQFEVQWRVPGFARRCEAADTAAAYAEFRALLQTQRWLRGEAADRPWVLKVPQFTQDLPALLATFPDARLLCLERPAAAVVASAASLVYNQMQLQSDHADPHWIGREWLRKFVHRRGVVAHALAAYPGIARHAVSYAAMDEDWRGVMRGIGDFLGLDPKPAVERRMAMFAARRAGGGHRYGLGDFGLDDADVRQALAAEPTAR